jgi:peptidoglycan/LPS O-acetylase OafA/YrhL
MGFLFFVVSGFVIFWTLNRTKNPLDFIVSRFSRLYPVYWLAVVITFLSVNLWGLEGREVGVLDAVINLTMLQSFVGISPVDGVYWTLKVELIFYFWMFLLFLLNNHKNADLILVPIVVLSVIESLGVVEVNSVLSGILIKEHISFFISGICFYKIINDIDFKRSITILLICLISTIFTFTFMHFIFFTGIYLFFYLGITQKIRGLENKILVYLGGVSYALYLVHQNLGYIVINKFYEIGLGGEYGIGLAIIISFIISHILTFKVERPALHVIRSLYKRAKFKLDIR